MQPRPAHPSRGEYRASGRVHTPNRVGPPVGHHQLNTARQLHLLAITRLGTSRQADMQTGESNGARKKTHRVFPTARSDRRPLRRLSSAQQVLGQLQHLRAAPVAVSQPLTCLLTAAGADEGEEGDEEEGAAGGEKDDDSDNENEEEQEEQEEQQVAGDDEDGESSGSDVELVNSQELESASEGEDDFEMVAADNIVAGKRKR